MEKSDEQWCKDNGVPPTARYTDSCYVMDIIKVINGQLKGHNLKIRTKHRRGHGTGSYIWVETVAQLSDEILQYLLTLNAKRTPGDWYFVTPRGNELETLVANIDDVDVPVLTPEHIGEEQCIANWDCATQATNHLSSLISEILFNRGNKS
jgi:hypothetical protein